jgi:leader peptidase (prepilin peptidase)/N-methyltransferase
MLWAWPLPVAAGLVLLAAFGIGWHPAIVGALYLAAVTPSLTREDIRSHRLPNALVLPGYCALAAGVTWRWSQSGAVPWAELASVGVAVGALLLMNVLGGLGMGDVKLGGVLAGTLALISPGHALVGLVVGFLLGGVASVVVLVSAALVAGSGVRGRSIPFGPFLLAGFWATVGMLAFA